MGMLSQIFGTGQTPQAALQTTGVQQTQADNRGREFLSGYAGGQTFEGKITGIKGNEVQIELPNGGQVNAKLDNAMSLKPGQTLTFEVRSNSANQISLTPLYTNLSMDPTAAKALAAAGMAVNADTLAMTTAMMERGMNIDKSSLQDMFHMISGFPGKEIGDLVEMQKLGLPMDEQTIEQYSAFKNYENQISEGLREISEQALALYEELGGDEGLPEALRYMRQLTEVITREMPGETAADPSGDTAHVDPETGKMILSAEAGGTDAAVFGEWSELLERAVADGTGEKDGVRAAVTEGLPEKMPAAETAGEQRAAEQVKQAVAKLAQQLAPDSSLASDIRNMNATDTQVLKLADSIVKALENHGGGFEDKALEQQLKDILRMPAFKEVVKNAMKDNWMLRPEQVGDKGNVENLYQKLTQQSKEMTQLLQGIAGPDSGLAQSLGNMSSQMDFMDQMNQAFQYIQLPLKMNGSEATGDLYVYSDKKSLANRDGSVSAMLHLDMQYLGTVDVYASITSQDQVSTKFYLESDEVMDLIGAHIGELNERLEKRGYSIRSEIKKHSDLDETSGRIRKLTAPSAGAKPVLKQSFDVRA